MKNLVTKFLQGHGFAKVTPSILVCKTEGQVVHHVTIDSSKIDGTSVRAAVTHPLFLPIREDLRFANSLITGKMSPRGVTSNWTWKDEPAFKVNSALTTLLDFFGNFKEFEDIRRVLSDCVVPPELALVLNSSKCQEWDLDIPIAKYPVTGGALSSSDARRVAQDFLLSMLRDDGFVGVPGSDVVAVRPRGQLFECVRVVLDEFSIIASLTCFLWSKEVWRADRRWKGSYYPFVPLDVQIDDTLWTVQTRCLCASDYEVLRSKVRNLFLTVAEVTTVEEFIELIGPEWGSVKSALINVSRREARI